MRTQTPWYSGHTPGSRQGLEPTSGPMCHGKGSFAPMKKNCLLRVGGTGTGTGGDMIILSHNPPPCAQRSTAVLNIGGGERGLFYEPASGGCAP